METDTKVIDSLLIEALPEALKPENRKDFICFLRFCAEHLNKGYSVQEVWRDYQAKAAQK